MKKAELFHVEIESISQGILILADWCAPAGFYDVTLTPVKPKPDPFAPPWDDAPDWAEWAARNKSCVERWYETRPRPGSDKSPWWTLWDGRSDLIRNWLDVQEDHNWRDTLQERPKPEPLCPICGKPASEHTDGLFCCPRCGGSMGLFEWKVAPLSGGWCSQCDDCWSWGPVRQDKADAIEAGNRRA